MKAITEKKARLLDLTTSVLELVRDRKRDIDQVSEVFQTIKNNSDFVEKLSKKFAEMIVSAESLPKNSTVFEIAVNYDLGVEEAVKAGKYDWVNENITSKNFPSDRKGSLETEIILVHFNREIESEDVIKELSKQGLRPAELPELLAFRTKYPDIQRDFPIVALGSVWRHPDGSRPVPYLYRDSGRRFLGLRWFACAWRSRYRFAALRK